MIEAVAIVVCAGLGIPFALAAFSLARGIWNS